MDRIRLEAIEKRRQQCSDIVRNRKRKLSDLYYLTRFPVIPVTAKDLQDEEDSLLSFLEKNDLESGRVFVETSLPEALDGRLDPTSRSKRAKTESPSLFKSTISGITEPTKAKNDPPASHSPSSSAVSQTVSKTDEIKAAEEPISRPKSTPAALSKSTDRRSVVSSLSSPSINTTAVSVSSSARSLRSPATPAGQDAMQPMASKPCTIVKPRNVGVREPTQLNPISINYPKDKESEMLLFLVPNRLPEPPQSRNPLAEMYYTTQQSPLAKLLPAAHKSLSTSNYQLSLLEGKLAVVHARIEELKRSSKWSLRQHQKFKAPLRPKTHWDHLLDEMRWMQVDFKEERKLKLAVCAEIAHAVRDYWKYGKEECCIKPAPINFVKDKEVTVEDVVDTISTDIEMKEANDISEVKAEVEKQLDAATKDDEVVSTVELPETKAIDVALLTKIKKTPTDYDTLVPTKIEDEATEEVTDWSPFKSYATFEDLNAASKQIFKMLPELPAFTPNAPYINEFDSLSLTSVTKFLSAPDLGRGWQRLVIDITETYGKIPASDPEGPLFGKEHRRHSGVRVPQPPSLKYLEQRTPTMWLPQDDNKLLRLAKEYNHNWGVISMNMFPEITFGYASSIERRSPWQCFERWYQLNPSMDVSDLRGPYALAAQKWLDAVAKVQAQARRRMYPMGTLPESVPRGHRRLRWASMFDAIRKNMKKRENAPKPNNSVQRKSQLDTAARMNVPSPADLSRLKFDRDRAMAEQFANQTSSLFNGGRPPAQNVPRTATANRNAGGGGGSGVNEASNDNFPAAAPQQQRANIPATAAGLPPQQQARGIPPHHPQALQGQQITPMQQQRGVANNGNNRVNANSPQFSASQARSHEQLQTLIAQRQAAVARQQQQQQQQVQSPQMHAQNIRVANNRGSPAAVPTPQQLQAQAAQQQSIQAMIQRSFSQQQVQGLIDRFKQQQPSLSDEDARRLAYQQIQRVIQQRQLQQQQAAATAAGAAGPAAQPPAPAR